MKGLEALFAAQANAQWSLFWGQLLKIDPADFLLVASNEYAMAAEIIHSACQQIEKAPEEVSRTLWWQTFLKVQINWGETKNCLRTLECLLDFYQKNKLAHAHFQFQTWMKDHLSWYRLSSFYHAYQYAVLGRYQEAIEQVQVLLKQFQGDLSELKLQLRPGRVLILQELLVLLDQKGFIETAALGLRDGNSSPLDLAELICLSSDKYEAMAISIQHLEGTGFEVLAEVVLHYLAATSSSRKMKNWASKKRSTSSLVALREIPALTFQEMVELMAKRLRPENDGATKVETSCDQVTETRKNNEAKEAQFSMVNPRLLAPLRPHQIDLLEREWNLDLIKELNEKQDHYMAMIVIEFIKTTRPLAQEQMATLLSMELHTSEKLGWEKRSKRLLEELATFNK